MQPWTSSRVRQAASIEGKKDARNKEVMPADILSACLYSVHTMFLLSFSRFTENFGSALVLDISSRGAFIEGREGYSGSDFKLRGSIQGLRSSRAKTFIDDDVRQ